MTGEHDDRRTLTSPADTTAGRLAMVVLTALAMIYLASSDYPAAAFGAILALIFVAYVLLRIMVFFENDRFTPKRLRVGLGWAFVGIDPGTDEFDSRPVRVYFILLLLLLVGLVVRPFLRWFLE